MVKKKQSKWIKVAKESDLPNGRVKTVVADKQQIFLYLYSFSNDLINNNLNNRRNNV